MHADDSLTSFLQRELLQRILDGSWRPGDKLPTRRELSRQFKCSPMTLQKALDGLRQDGFITTIHRLGTMVSEKPPHTHRFGILFNASPDQQDKDGLTGGWNALWQIMLDVLPDVERSSECSLVPYYHIMDSLANDATKILLDDVSRSRLAGVILAVSPRYQPNLFQRLKDDLPVIAVACESTRYSTIHIDSWRLIALGVKALAQRGAKRVACLIHMQDDDTWRDRIRKLLSDQCLDSAPYLMQELHIPHVQQHASVTSLLMELERDKRPDAILIADDNLVPGVTAALKGRRDFADILVAAHANFPHATKAHIPVVRYGPNVTEMLSAAIGVLPSLGKNSVVSVQPESYVIDPV